jgi:hypothetical protein
VRTTGVESMGLPPCPAARCRTALHRPRLRYPWHEPSSNHLQPAASVRSTPQMAQRIRHFSSLICLPLRAATRSQHSTAVDIGLQSAQLGGHGLFVAHEAATPSAVPFGDVGASPHETTAACPASHAVVDADAGGCDASCRSEPDPTRPRPGCAWAGWRVGPRSAFILFRFGRG